MLLDILHGIIIVIVVSVISLLLTNFKKRKELDKEIKRLKEEDEVLHQSQIIQLKFNKNNGMWKRLLIIPFFLVYFNFIHNFSSRFILIYIPLSLAYNILIGKRIRRYFYDRA